MVSIFAYIKIVLDKYLAIVICGPSYIFAYKIIVLEKQIFVPHLKKILGTFILEHVDEIMADTIY